MFKTTRTLTLTLKSPGKPDHTITKPGGEPRMFKTREKARNHNVVKAMEFHLMSLVESNGGIDLKVDMSDRDNIILTLDEPELLATATFTVTKVEETKKSDIPEHLSAFEAMLSSMGLDVKIIKL